MHPYFPELIAAFKDEPEAYDNFIAIVCFFFSMILQLYAHILILIFLHVSLHFFKFIISSSNDIFRV